MLKLEFTGITLFFLISARKHKLWASTGTDFEGGSNEYPQSIFWAEIWKKYRNFYLKIFIFLVKFSVYLNKLVFVSMELSLIIIIIIIIIIITVIIIIIIIIIIINKQQLAFSYLLAEYCYAQLCLARNNFLLAVIWDLWVGQISCSTELSTKDVL